MAERQQRRVRGEALGPSHEETWGATEVAKAKWDRLYGDAVRKATDKANEEDEDA